MTRSAMLCRVVPCLAMIAMSPYNPGMASAGRQEILQTHIQKQGLPLAEDVTVTSIAASTTGFTGADLANLVNEAALLAGRSDKGLLCLLSLTCFAYSPHHALPTVLPIDVHLPNLVNEAALLAGRSDKGPLVACCSSSALSILPIAVPAIPVRLCLLFLSCFVSFLYCFDLLCFSSCIRSCSAALEVSGIVLR